jgi:hypothetical protein
MINRFQQSRVLRFVRRHRVGIQDLSFLALVVLAVGYFAYTYDIFVAPGATPVPDTTATFVLISSRWSTSRPSR